METIERLIEFIEAMRKTEQVTQEKDPGDRFTQGRLSAFDSVLRYVNKSSDAEFNDYG